MAGMLLPLITVPGLQALRDQLVPGNPEDAFSAQDAAV